MSWGEKKEVVSSKVMFGFLMCNIVQARLCVYWKSSDPFVCLGADCNNCTAVFSTRQTLYLVAAWTQAPRSKSACVWHVVSPKVQN